MQEGTIRIEMMMYWGSLALGYCLRLYGTFTSLSRGGGGASLSPWQSQCHMMDGTKVKRLNIVIQMTI